MGIVMKAIHELLRVLVDEHGMSDFTDPLVHFRVCRELAVEEEVRHFEEGAVLGEVFDGVSAIEEDAAVAVEVGDATLA
jgi:hypothetical protein